MITVNLLPIVFLKERHRGRLFLAACGLFLLAAAAVLFVVKLFVLDGTIREMTAELEARQSRLASVQKEVGEANQVTVSTVREWRQLMAILELDERRRDQTRLLVEIEELLPRDNAWLVTLKHEQGVLELEGISTDKETVSQFLTRLENADYIDRSSVNLVNITQNEVINNVKLTRFKVKADTVFPRPVIVDGGMPDYGLPPRANFLKLVEAAAPALAGNAQDNAAAAGRTL